MYQLETNAVHAGYQPEATTHSNVPPLYMTTAYSFDDTEHARKLFALEEGGNIYTRLQNPTTDLLEARVAALEGGIGALALSSGHAAIVHALLTIAREGDEIISANTIYGGAINLLGKTFKRMGITVHFASTDDPETFRALINDKTRAIFVEAIGNPTANVCDLEAIADIAHENGMLVSLWTVNKISDMVKVTECCPDNITTKKPVIITLIAKNKNPSDPL